jgi:hypothetical protein
MRQAYQLIEHTPRLFAKRWNRPSNSSNEEMLETLRRLLREHGHLDREIIGDTPVVPSSYAYEKRFGSISRAHQKIGYASARGRFKAAV